MGKKIISMILTFFIIMSLVLIPSDNVHALENELGGQTAFLFTINQEAVDFNTAWKEYQVDKRLSINVNVKNYTRISYDKANTHLMRFKNGQLKVANDSSSYVNSKYEYYYAFAAGSLPECHVHTEIANAIREKANAYGVASASEINGLVFKINDEDFKSWALVSVSDDNKNIVFYVSVTPSTIAKISSFYINPRENVSAEPGKTVPFRAAIEGNVANKGVNWSISGNKSSGTKIAATGETELGVNTAELTVDADETAESITVTATSKAFPSQKLDVEVKIGKSEEIKSIMLDMDEDGLYLSPERTEGEVSKKVSANVILNSLGIELDVVNSNLVYDFGSKKKGVLDGKVYGIGDGDKYVDPAKDYYLSLTIKRQFGYIWPEEVMMDEERHPVTDFSDMSVYIDGELRKDVYIQYNLAHISIDIYIPVDIWKENIKKHADQLVISGIEDKKYTGSEIKQNISVTYKGKALTEGKDYEVSYSNNVDVGKASISVKGIGDYKGTVTYSFEILKNESGNGNASGNDNGSGSGNGSGNNGSGNYKNEWVNGKWYNADGVNDYAGILSWKCNSTGWWVEDSKGWYPVSQWQKIDGKWYYFDASGYMESSCYRDGYWLGSDGALVDGYFGTWKSNSTGWWFEDTSGWYPSSTWVKIDGSWYYFEADGYMTVSKYVDGYWVGEDGACE